MQKVHTHNNMYVVMNAGFRFLERKSQAKNIEKKLQPIAGVYDNIFSHKIIHLA